MTGPLEAYQRRVNTGELTADSAQLRIATEFERLHQQIIAASEADQRFVNKVRNLFGRKREPVCGIYLWGSVGRGKTMLMDLFYHQLPLKKKQRQHFHRFMANVHRGLRRFKNQRDPLELVAEEISAKTRIICFDEFAVTDIADAMILGNLFRALFSRGVSLAATSNTEPQNLYEGGLQRAQFLPAIALIEAHTKVIRMDGNLDYRLKYLQRSDLYLYPADDVATNKLKNLFTEISGDEMAHDDVVDILGREIAFLKNSDGAIWFDFEQVCDGPRSQEDYIELSRCYQTVIISNVPQLTEFLENQARRFIALVDEFYDRKVKLILSASVPINELYVGKRLSHEMQRTRSRLQEMQSDDYLAAAHRP